MEMDEDDVVPCMTGGAAKGALLAILSAYQWGSMGDCGGHGGINTMGRGE